MQTGRKTSGEYQFSFIRHSPADWPKTGPHKATGLATRLRLASERVCGSRLDQIHKFRAESARNVPTECDLLWRDFR